MNIPLQSRDTSNAVSVVMPNRLLSLLRLIRDADSIPYSQQSSRLDLVEELDDFLHSEELLAAQSHPGSEGFYNEVALVLERFAPEEQIDDLKSYAKASIKSIARKQARARKHKHPLRRELDWGKVRFVQDADFTYVRYVLGYVLLQNHMQAY
jgi:hypothetical protein